MRKQIKVVRYIGVLFLTIMIFSLGIFLGGSVEQLRVESLYTQLQTQDLDYQNIVTEGNYLDYMVTSREDGNNVTCEMIKGTYYTSISNLDDARIKLENYINSGSVRIDEFSRLKGHYANIQINYWILANRIGNLCGNLNTILYFYTDDKKCPECEDQGVHLTYVKQKMGDDILIFALDLEKDGVTQLLAQNFGAYERGIPTLVINGEIKGFSTNEEIFEILGFKN